MEKLKIDKPIRLIELFAGIGSQAKALTRLDADFEHYRICEFDKYAVTSYNAIHGTDFTTSDITKISANDLGIVDTDKYCYIMTYSFPCQDLSLAGKQKGMAKGENTRSGLLWEVERLLKECTELPQILLMENVTQVHGTKNKEHFDEWLAYLESKGYKNYWKDLNAKNFGIPQNRNRTYMVSVLGEYFYEFPEEFPLELRLKDMLENSVDEKFYISNEKINKIANSTFAQEKTMIQKSDVCGTLLARDYKDPKCVEVEPVRIGGLYDTETSKHQAGAIWDKGAVAPTVDTMQGGNRQPLITEEPLAYDEQNGYIRKDGTVGTLTTDGSSPKHNNRVIIPTNNKKGYDEAFEGDTINLEQPSSKTRRGRVGHGVAQTLNTATSQVVVETVGSVEKTENLVNDVSNGKYPANTVYGKYLFQSSRFEDKPLEECSQTIKSTKVDCGVIHDLRIRKLTPKECWRLMGFDDADFDRAAQYNSNTQLYKQAGNSIVVDVLYYIFGKMLCEE